MPASSHQLKSGLERHDAGHVHSLIKRLRLERLAKRFPPRVVLAMYVFVNGFVTIALLSLLAVFTRTAFVFPSLGPTAYLFFFSPLARGARPRHAILGHAIGLICGYGALVLVGGNVAHGPQELIHWQSGFAAALSLAATGALMVLFRVSHPPAGATTLIVSLGLLSKPLDLLIIEVAVLLLTLQALLINRLAGIPYPLWEKREHKTAHSEHQL